MEPEIEIFDLIKKEDSLRGTLKKYQNKLGNSSESNLSKQEQTAKNNKKSLLDDNRSPNQEYFESIGNENNQLENLFDGFFNEKLEHPENEATKKLIQQMLSKYLTVEK